MTNDPARAFRVLAVDDEAGIREFVGRVLRQPGYEVRLAADGGEALRVAETEGTFDLLVTDVMMPRMRGDELARRLRQAVPDLKVLYLTGFSDRLFEARRVLWEDEAFLDKPVRVQGLLEAAALLLVGRLPAPRAVRVRIAGARVRLGDDVSTLDSLSVNGGLLHVPANVPVGSRRSLTIELPNETIRGTARVVSCEPSVPPDSPLPDAASFAVAFAFADLATSAHHALERAIRDAATAARPI